MRLLVKIKEHWLAIIGATGCLPSIGSAIKWVLQKLLETGEHIEFVANRWHDLPETRQMIESFPEIPQWIGLPLLLGGLGLIYMDSRRHRKAATQTHNLQQTPQVVQPDTPTVTKPWKHTLEDFYKLDFNNCLSVRLESC